MTSCNILKKWPSNMILYIHIIIVHLSPKQQTVNRVLKGESKWEEEAGQKEEKLGKDLCLSNRILCEVVAPKTTQDETLDPFSVSLGIKFDLLQECPEDFRSSVLHILKIIIFWSFHKDPLQDCFLAYAVADLLTQATPEKVQMLRGLWEPH